jgi:hypothetical protein
MRGCGPSPSPAITIWIEWFFVLYHTPLTDQAQTLSILEAVMGQMYLAVNIATLVAIRIAQSFGKNSE